jgi:gliding motility-associated-like protein
VNKVILHLNITIIFILFFNTKTGYAQLGFCNGNSGSAIFTETFGTGTNNVPLPAGTTSYTYVNGDPQDGQYTVSNNTAIFDWHAVLDHTPDDTNGRCLIINADFTAGEFYRTNVMGLCENTSYEFSAWLINLLPPSGCGGSGIPINVKFEIWDSTDSNLLASGDTGNISGTNNPNWDAYALVFTTLPGQTSVLLKMLNNGTGGCGNDLAIDDIVFKSCGDSILVEDEFNNNGVSYCSSQTPVNTTLSAVPDNSVFSNHFYQWQESTDTNVWTDIIGATNQNLILTGLTSTTYYRALVAEFPSNLNNLDCVTFSNVFEVLISDLPNQPTLECWETATINNNTCSWEISGTQPVAPSGLACWESTTFNTTLCAWEINGVQPPEPTTACWETATFNTTTCLWEVAGTQSTMPNTTCWESTIFNHSTCLWEISGTQPLEPTGLECWESTTFNNTICAWEIFGSQPVEPTTDCWETTTFNTNTCLWEINGDQPTEPNGLECWETATFNNTTCLWEISGTQPLEPTGLECWEVAIFNDTLCVWEVSGDQNSDTIEEVLNICDNQSTFLSAETTLTNPTFLWSSGETSESILIESPGIYSVEIRGNGCVLIVKTFDVSFIEAPIIESVTSDGNNVVVATTNSGDFEFSSDGVFYQPSHTFALESGLYTIFVREQNGCGIVSVDYLHFVIPKFFTPNNDGYNDRFNLKGIEIFKSSEVYIFNRYGKLLKSSRNSPFSWDGTFNNVNLSNSDYWYLIRIEGQEFKGHFTLKR